MLLVLLSMAYLQNYPEGNMHLNSSQDFSLKQQDFKPNASMANEIISVHIICHLKSISRDRKPMESVKAYLYSIKFGGVTSIILKPIIGHGFNPVVFHSQPHGLSPNHLLSP
jgi:hypothetical protein